MWDTNIEFPALPKGLSVHFLRTGLLPCGCPGACSADIILFICISKQMLEFGQHPAALPGGWTRCGKDGHRSLVVAADKPGTPGTVPQL